MQYISPKYILRIVKFSNIMNSMLFVTGGRQNWKVNRNTILTRRQEHLCISTWTLPRTCGNHGQVWRQVWVRRQVDGGEAGD